MDLDELSEALRMIGVPPDLIEIGSVRDNAFCLLQVAENRWEVTWREQGVLIERYATDSEAGACLLLLGRVGSTWLDAIAGSSGTGLSRGVPASHPAVRALLTGYDPLAGMSADEWDQSYWPGNPVDSRGRRVLSWPPYDRHPDGFSSPDDRTPIVLEPDTVVDQFGPAFSRYVYPVAAPFSHRGLPPDYLDVGYHQYAVVEPVPVWAGTVAPAFGQPGGGVQYFMLQATGDLVGHGYLREIEL